MDKNTVDMYLMSNATYFPADKIEFIREKLLKLDDSQYNMLLASTSSNMKNPTTMLLVSVFVGGLGIDRFMLGDSQKGIIKILGWLLCLIGGVVLWIMDVINITNMTKDYNFNLFMKQLTAFPNAQTTSTYNVQSFAANNPASNIYSSNVPAPNVAPVPQNASVQFVPTAAANQVKSPKTSEPLVGIATDVLIKRAFLFLEDGNFEEADRYLEQALNQDPENSRAYLGKLMVEKRVRTEDDLTKLTQPLDDEKFFKRAMRFANEDEKARLQGYAQAVRAN